MSADTDFVSSQTRLDRDAMSELKFQRMRERLRKNFPKTHAPLRWRKVTERIIRSTCERFQVEKRGEADATRYFAFILPDKVIGHRLRTADEAKQVCERHALPLPLGAPPAAPPGVQAAGPREPGSDDELGEVSP